MSEQNIDVSKKFVRMTEKRPDGLVEFDFAIGEPELFVELLMPEAAYTEFCSTNDVILLQGHRPAADGPEDWDWRMKQATSQRFK